jgi:hypothetical protein
MTGRSVRQKADVRASGSVICPWRNRISPPTDDSAACLADVEDPKTDRMGLLRPATFDTQSVRVVQSSHLPFGLAGPSNIAHLPQAVASAAGVKKRHPLQVLLGSGDVSV